MRSSTRSSNVDHESGGGGGRRNDHYHYGHHHHSNRIHSESNGHGGVNNNNNGDYSRSSSSSSKRPATTSSGSGNIIKRMKSSTNLSHENNVTSNNVDHSPKKVSSSKASVTNKQLPAGGGTNALISMDPNECHQLTFKGVLLEEQEALSQDKLDDAGQNDMEKFSEAATGLRQLIKTVLELKKKDRQSKKPSNDDDGGGGGQLLEIKANGLMHLAEMKNLNRLDKFRLREARKRLAGSKDKVDQIHLQLQNLQYEVMHLQKERKTCDSFRSKDEILELVNEEKFLLSDSFPDDLRHLLVIGEKDGKSIRLDRERATNEEFHRIHLARLDWELQQRVSSNNQLKQAEESRFRLEVEISAKTRTFSLFDPVLRNVIEAAKPLTSQLNVPLQIYNSNNSLTPFLPQPLYVLFTQLCAYKYAFGHNFEVTIQGLAEEAQQYEKQEKNVPNLERWLKNKAEEEDGGTAMAADDDLDDEMDHHRKKSKKSSRYHSHKSPKKSMSDLVGSSSSDPMAPSSEMDTTQATTPTVINDDDDQLMKCQELIQCHPMKVNLMFRQRHYQMICTFSYFSKLEIIGMSYKIENLSYSTSGTEFTVTDFKSNMFSKLLSNTDTGYKCPNLVVEYLLRRFGIIEYQKLFPYIGYTYDWAQRLAGIEYLDAEERPILTDGSTIRVRTSIAIDSMDKTVKLMMLRFQSRINLQEQLQEIRDKKTIDPDRFLESSGIGDTTIAKSRTTIQSFHRITSDRLIQELDERKKINLIGYFDSSDTLSNDLFDNENFIFYMIARNSVPDTSMKYEFEFGIYIIVPQNYPWRWPYVILTSSNNNTSMPERKNDDFFLNQSWLRSLEEHINVLLPQKIVKQAQHTDESIFSTTLLLRQIYDLQYGLDVIVEARPDYMKRATDEIAEAYSGPRFVNSLMSTSIIQGRDHSLKFI